MKIVFAGHDSVRDISGVSSWLIRLLPLLRDSGLQVEAHLFQTDTGPGATAGSLRRQGIQCRTAPWPENTAAGVDVCLHWLLESRPDVYVPNCIVPAYFASAIARNAGALTVAVLHSDDPFYHGIIDNFIAGDKHWRIDATVAVSHYLRDVALNQSPPKFPTICIPCGVPVSQTVPAPPDPSPFRLIWTGRMVEEQKRATDTAHALGRALDKWPDISVTMIGDGPAFPSVKNVLAAHIASGRVGLPGRIDPANVTPWLVRSHAFVLLSDYEGLSVALLEAMSSGVAPICLSTRSGVHDAIAHEVNGLIVHNREDDFLAAVERLHDDAALRKRIGAAARATVVERYSIDACATSWLEFLAQHARAPIGSIRYHPPHTIKLPPHNPKLGYFDRRPPGLLQRIRKRLTGLRPRR